MGRVVQMKRKSRWWRGIDPDNEDEPQYAGYDAEIECMMSCVEELARLEGRKGAASRNAVMEYLIQRYNREDAATAQAARPVED